MTAITLNALYHPDGSLKGMSCTLDEHAHPDDVQQAMRMLARAGMPASPYADPAATHVMQSVQHSDPLTGPMPNVGPWTH